MRTILIVTGTRADWGKWWPVYTMLRDAPDFDVHVAITGQHMDPRYGLTLVEVQREVPTDKTWPFGNDAGNDLDQLGTTARAIRGIIDAVEPGMVLVHGDRMEALGAAIAGHLHGVLVGHVEGGELSGNVDESTRHAVSKYAHVHMVANDQARARLMAMGEDPERVHVTGSPEVDAMLGPLPDLDAVRDRYGIPWDEYGVLCYHPETSLDPEQQRAAAVAVIGAAHRSGLPWVVLEPNCDRGSGVVRAALDCMAGEGWRRLPSMRFTHYLRLLHDAQVVLGNSSSGVREAPVFGTPSVSVGGRQSGRVQAACVRYVEPVTAAIDDALRDMAGRRFDPEYPFGRPGAAQRIVDVVRREDTWETRKQKRWVA